MAWPEQKGKAVKSKKGLGTEITNLCGARITNNKLNKYIDSYQWF